jgi:hypothetical protein
MSEENDFGFTTYNENIPDVYQQTVYVDKKAKDMYDLIFPFLDKLRTSEGDIIKWPYGTRSFQITKMLSNMRAILAEGYAEKPETKKLTEEEIQFHKAMGTLKI